MVRIKHRYFLVHILYPDSESALFRSSDPNLPDTLRFHQPTPDAITPPILLGDIREHVSTLFGDYGAGVAGLQLSIKYMSPATSTFILRCPRAHFRLVWAALAMVTSLPLPKSASAQLGLQGRDRLPCVLRVIRVSGTIRKAEEAAIAQAKQVIIMAKSGKPGKDLWEGLIPKAPKVEKEVELEEFEDEDEDDAMETDED